MQLCKIISTKIRFHRIITSQSFVSKHQHLQVSNISYLKDKHDFSDELTSLADQYRETKSLAILDESLELIRRERHCFELNERLHLMLSALPGTTRSAEPTVAEYKRLASLLTIEKFSSQNLGDQKSDLSMESLTKSFVFHPVGASAVTFKFEWTLARKNIPGMIQNECLARLHANDTPIASASDVHRSISQESIKAIAQHLNATHLPLSDFCWFVSFVATFPSDEAFDVLSELMLNQLVNE